MRSWEIYLTICYYYRFLNGISWESGGDPVLHPQLGQPVHDLHRLQTHRHDPLDQIDDVLGIVGPIVGVYRAWKPRSPVAVCDHRFSSNMVEVLIRNVAFISAMMESNVDFVCCDFPEANRLTIHILAAVAEHEREIISKRTKDALQVAKSRGVRLGNPNLRGDNQKRKERADAFAEGLRGTLDGFQAQGFTQERMIQELNGMRVCAPSGGSWGFTQLRRVLNRLNRS